MAKSGSRTFPFGVLPAAAYALLVWVLLADQAFEFPLGERDQGLVMEALGSRPGLAGSRPVAGIGDSLLAGLVGSDPYTPLQAARRFGMAAALVGMAVWLWRDSGPIQGVWAGLLGLAFLPTRLTGLGLAPQAECLALLVWGHLLTLGKPWSKTGAVEQAGGGFLLGSAVFAAPWGWLFAAGPMLRSLVSGRERNRLEAVFRFGALAGLGCGATRSAIGQGGGSLAESAAVLSGVTVAGLGRLKLEAVYTLVSDYWGWAAVFAALLGCIRPSESAAAESKRGLDLVWPIFVSVPFGIADEYHTSLAFPGLIFLWIAGLQRIGAVFVSKLEGVLAPTFFAFALTYFWFFSGLPVVRERQAYSREVASLARLIEERVPAGDPLALFRLNPLVDYLNALDEFRAGARGGSARRRVPVSLFRMGPDEAAARLLERYGPGSSVWIDAKRLTLEEPRGHEVLARLRTTFRVDDPVSLGPVSLIRVHLGGESE